MKVRRLLCVALVLVCTVTLWGCSNNSNPITARTSYYIQWVVPFAFGTGVDINTGEDENPYAIADNTLSHLMFDTDFKSMWIDFVDTPTPGRVIFVITSGTPQNGNIRGTAARIIQSGPDVGKLVRYSFWSNRDTIYMRALVTYRIATEHEGKHDIVTIERGKIVAEFSRAPLGGDA